MDDLELIDTGTGRVTYDTVRQAMNGDTYAMNLTGEPEIEAVVQAVNMGIDSRLQACYTPDYGDSYRRGVRKGGGRVLCGTLECVVSDRSLPVLLRRLFERGRSDEAAEVLARDILESLGVDADSGQLLEEVDG